MTNHPRSPRPDEPLTCSEVVERLIKEAYFGPWTTNPRLDREQAAAILHSWRERRVQELEEALREIVELTDGAGAYGSGAEETVSACRETAKEGLAKSDEWREQIRKGATHD